MALTAEHTYQTAWALDPERAAQRAAEQRQAVSRRTVGVLGAFACTVWLFDLALVVVA